MKLNLKQTLLLCGLAVMLAAFPVFGQVADREIRINRKPLQDFSDSVISLVQKKEVDLNENFLVEIEGELNDNGKFDVEKTKYVRAEGNEKMFNVAKQGIEAVNDSGLFQYITQLSGNKINVIFAQDNEKFYAILKTDLHSQQRAKSFQSSMTMLLRFAETKKKETNSDNDRDDLTLLKGTTISVEDKTISIRIAIEKSVAQEMIGRKLKKEMDKRIKEKVN